MDSEGAACGIDVPGEVLLKILLYLPVKSLIRFRCVCKSWKSLIESTDFVSTHLDLDRGDESPSRLLLMHYSLDRKKTRYTLYADRSGRSLVEKLELEFPFQSYDTFHYVGSCAGLICFSNYLVNCLQVVLWNPSTRLYRMVPVPRFLDSDLSFYDVLGFGFDQKHREYKVLRLIHVHGHNWSVEGSPEAEIYDVRTNSWRQISADVPCIVPRSSSQVFLNGFVHWIGFSRDIRQSKLVVMSLDVHRETFEKINLPDSTQSLNSYNVALAESCGSLCLIEKDIVSGFCLWIRNDYGIAGSWTKMLAIDLVGELSGSKRVVGFRMKGEVMLVSANEELVSYGPKSGEISRHGLRGIPRSFSVVPYIECLSLLDALITPRL